MTSGSARQCCQSSAARAGRESQTRHLGSPGCNLRFPRGSSSASGLAWMRGAENQEIPGGPCQVEASAGGGRSHPPATDSGPKRATSGIAPATSVLALGASASGSVSSWKKWHDFAGKWAQNQKQLRQSDRAATGAVQAAGWRRNNYRLRFPMGLLPAPDVSF